MFTIILANLLVTISNADLCISGQGNTNIQFYGQYEELGPDSNGYMQYKEETVCNDNDNYLYNIYDIWVTSETLGSTSFNIRCTTQSSSIQSPIDCPAWSIPSVSVTDSNCPEVILPCDTIEISGAFSVSNGIYDKVQNGDNLYKKDGDDYWLSYRAADRVFYGTRDGDVRCDNSVNYTLAIAQDSLSSLSDGTESIFTPTFPGDRQITVKCNPETGAQSTTSTPSTTSTSATTTTSTAATTSATTTTSTTTSTAAITSTATTTSTTISTSRATTTPAPETSASGSPAPALASLPSNICVSGDLQVNQRFIGNYELKTDANGPYYEKEQAFCDDEPEYLYTDNGYWEAQDELNAVDNPYLRCPDQNIASPDLCTTGTWRNGSPDPDPAVSVTANACPDDEFNGVLGCDYILLQDTGNENNNIQNGLYTKIGDNLYEKDNYYFQYSKEEQMWIIATSDVRELCVNPLPYFRSGDTAINTLAVGDVNVEIDVSHPAQTGDYSCKQPKISCLDSVPTDEVLNDALCNFPCNINDIIPSLSCNYIEIDILNSNHVADGVYEQVNGEVNLYQKDNTYFFQYYIRGEYYAITLNDDRNLCGDTGPSAYLRSTDSDIDTLQNGISITASLDYPVGGSATINCLAQPPTASPVPAAPDGLCVAVEAGWSTGGMPLTDIAGTYVLMDTQVNGKDAYELNNECGTTAYISSDDSPAWYFLTIGDVNDPYPNGWLAYCTNSASINGDVSQCIWGGGLQSLFQVTSGGGCSCGQTLGSSALAPMMEPKDIEPIFPNDNIGAPSTDTKPIGIWSQFVDILHTETMAVILTLILIIMIIWTMIMCGYLFGCNKSNKKYYSPAKLVDDQI